jgi:hypothetical protein
VAGKAELTIIVAKDEERSQEGREEVRKLSRIQPCSMSRYAQDSSSGRHSNKDGISRVEKLSSQRMYYLGSDMASIMLPVEVEYWQVKLRNARHRSSE